MGPVSWKSPYLESVASNYLETDSFLLHYLKKGSGPPLILIHGGGVWLYTFRRNIEHLAKHFCVYALDMPGYGYTIPRNAHQAYGLEANNRFLLDFKNRLGISRASLLGHSWGGGWALAFASMHPESVDKLILIDSSGLDVPDVPEWELLKIPVMGPFLLRFVTVGAVSRRLDHSFFRRNMVTPEMALEVYRPLKFSHNRRGQILTARNQDWALTEKAMPGIENPALILWGDHDRYLAVSLLDRFRQLLPHASSHIFKDCGHSPHEECPQEVNGLVTDFLHPG